MSNLYGINEQEQLADRPALSGMSEVFFCNSGCEANEARVTAGAFLRPPGR